MVASEVGVGRAGLIFGAGLEDNDAVNKSLSFSAFIVWLSHLVTLVQNCIGCSKQYFSRFAVDPLHAGVVAPARVATLRVFCDAVRALLKVERAVREQDAEAARIKSVVPAVVEIDAALKWSRNSRSKYFAPFDYTVPSVLESGVNSLELLSAAM